MPDIFQLIASWKKQIFLVVLLSLISVAAIIFILPPKYLAATTAIPANPVTLDRSIVFNNNIRDLYNSLGAGSDADILVGIAQLDTIYIAVAKLFKLDSVYSIKVKVSDRLLIAANKLKKNTRILKTEFGELQVRVRDKNRLLAPELANALMEQLALIYKNALSAHNKTMASALTNQVSVLQTRIGELESDNRSQISELTSLREQVTLYKKLIDEYNVMLRSETSVIHIVEPARASIKPDAPAKALVLATTAIVSFLFALWLAVLLEKRKKAAM